jgi:hypothetical protein
MKPSDILKVGREIVTEAPTVFGKQMELWFRSSTNAYLLRFGETPVCVYERDGKWRSWIRCTGDTVEFATAQEAAHDLERRLLEIHAAISAAAGLSAHVENSTT